MQVASNNHSTRHCLWLEQVEKTLNHFPSENAISWSFNSMWNYAHFAKYLFRRKNRKKVMTKSKCCVSTFSKWNISIFVLKWLFRIFLFCIIGNINFKRVWTETSHLLKWSILIFFWFFSLQLSKCIYFPRIRTKTNI